MRRSRASRSEAEPTPPPWRVLIVGCVVSLAAFVASGYLIYAWHDEISSYMVLTYAVVGVAGLAALAAPIFIVKLGPIDIQRSHIMAAARWMKPVK
jgi:hypothetical protein